MLVVAQHLLHSLSENGHAWAGAVITTVDLGKFGVALFFLISGFVIPFSFKSSLVEFWIGRMARLLPVLWLSILFCIAIGASIQSGTHLFANAFMLTHVLGQPKISDPYWTLSWELYFYAIAALAFAAGRIDRQGTFGVLAIGFASFSMLDPRVCYLVFMFTGTLLRMLLLERRAEARGWLYASIAALTAACCLWALRGDRPPEFFAGLALALPAFLFLRERLTHPALLWFGGISYSLYLFHLPIIEALQSTDLRPLVFIASGITLPIAVAAVVHRLVEVPMIAQGKALARKLKHEPLEPAAVAANSARPV
jgi:peptidoglycan/LPS O-acetylase OafA/YrhL